MKINYPLWKRRALLGGLILLGGVLAASPWWGPRALSHLSFFRLTRVEVHGLRYMAESQLRERLGADTTQSIWMDLQPLEQRLAAHPQLLSVTLSRKLPGTLVVRVEERQPVAIVPSSRGFTAIDERGATIPVDPANGDVDVPVLHKNDSIVVRLLANLRRNEPALYHRISEISRVGRDELRIELATVSILAMTDVTVQRLLDILPVERDLARKGVQVAELDLRFFGSGQVIARLK